MAARVGCLSMARVIASSKAIRQSWCNRKRQRAHPLLPHLANFLAAIRSRKHQDLRAEVDIGRQSADLCHLANISYRLGGQLLKFDAQKGRFENQQANALAHPSYRAPYIIPSIA